MEAIARAVDGKAIPKPTRVLMVAPPSRGGLARHVVALLEGLACEGYEVGVSCQPDGPIAEAAEAHSMPVYAVNLGGRGPSATLVSVVQAARAAGAMQARIIHTHAFRAGLVGALMMPGAPGAKLVATIHNFPPPGPSHGRRANRRAGPPGAPTMKAGRSRERWAVRMLLRRADRLITVSEALRGKLIELRSGVEAKSITIPNGVNTSQQPMEQEAARETLGLRAEGPVVGMVARLAPAKGIPQFLDACKLISGRFPAARFVLAGGGPLWEEAIAKRDELGLADRLDLLGEVASTREVMGALDVLVVASTSEGSSVVAMEAMSEGKPVVATNVGGLPEVVVDGETGLLVEADDPAALAQAALRLLGEPELGRQMGLRGRQRAKQCFDKREMVARVKEVYADLLREEADAAGGRK